MLHDPSTMKTMSATASWVQTEGEGCQVMVGQVRSHMVLRRKLLSVPARGEKVSAWFTEGSGGLLVMCASQRGKQMSSSVSGCGQFVDRRRDQPGIGGLLSESMWVKCNKVVWLTAGVICWCKQKDSKVLIQPYLSLNFYFSLQSVQHQFIANSKLWQTLHPCA